MTYAIHRFCFLLYGNYHDFLGNIEIFFRFFLNSEFLFFEAANQRQRVQFTLLFNPQLEVWLKKWIHFFLISSYAKLNATYENGVEHDSSIPLRWSLTDIILCNESFIENLNFKLIVKERQQKNKLREWVSETIQKRKKKKLFIFQMMLKLTHGHN